jgi:hypothetical protein
MARTNISKVLARVRARAMAKVAVVALVDGKTVVSHHTDFQTANAALCAALDAFYDNQANQDKAHQFDLVPLSKAVRVGMEYHHSDKVFMP